MEIDLRQYHHAVYSQFGQDGVLEKIFEKIGVMNKYFVEFGSEGTDCGLGNTPNLRRSGWDGLLMNYGEWPYGTKTPKKYDVKNEKVTAETVEFLFEKYSVPIVFDFLSIDVDGEDYHIWEAIKNYYPRVVCIESNHALPGNEWMVQQHNPDHIWEGNTRFGASPLAMKELGNKKGYCLVAVCVCDLIFIRDDIADCCGTIFQHANDLSVLYKQTFPTTGYERSWDKWIKR